MEPIEQLDIKAKEAFKNYAKIHPDKITFEEFQQFINDFYTKEQSPIPSLKEIKQLFKESKTSSSSTEQEVLKSEEFQETWKDLTISRMKTKDNLTFD